MTSTIRRVANRICGIAGLSATALLLAAALAGPARADVKLRVEARPIKDPIQAFVTVTNGAGAPVDGLAAADFTVFLDGDKVNFDAGDVTLPPAVDANQKVSIVFAMDYSASVTSGSLDAMRKSVKDFSNSMEDGDQIAIVKFNDTTGASVVLPFTTIDHAANNFDIAVAVDAPYPGDGTNLLDALELSINQFIQSASLLPIGPKAIILISDGGENESSANLSDVLALANVNSIPIFTIGIGDLTVPGREDLMSGLGSETGGQYFPTATDQDIEDAYASISILLTHEYLIEFFPGKLGNCAEHTLEVTVTGRAPVSVLFTRRTCDTEPDPFTFNAQTNVARGENLTSNTVTISGIEAPAHVSVIGGRYSLDCDGTFTAAPGTISDGQTICVRQDASDLPSTTKVTTLTVGGIAGTFSTTTRAGGGSGGGGGGGGGMTGLLELLLLGIGALFLGRRRLA